MKPLAPFTIKQSNYIKNSMHSWLNVAEGGKRAGKNVITIIAWATILETHPDRIHLAAGFSIASAKLNIFDCNGYGLLNYFKGRYKEGKYQDRSCLYIQTAVGQKVILVSGGGKKNDLDLIKGNTYGTAYITEVNTCHESFIKEVFDRTLLSSDRKVFHDLNPKAPKHKYYTDVLDFHQDKQKEDSTYGLNYQHFTVLDNLSISTILLRKLLKTYDKQSVWYMRDILGLRKTAEGLIYRLFANNPDAYIIDKIPLHDIAFITIGIDFGGNKSGQAFNATSYSRDMRRIYTIADFWNDEQMDAKKLCNHFLKFLKYVQSFKKPIISINGDSAETVLMNSIRNKLISNRISIPVVNAIKGIILDRIRFYDLMFALEEKPYKIYKDCTYTINAFENARWKDSKQMKDERLDDGSSNIDTLDAQEYSTEEFMEQLMVLMGISVNKKG